MEFLYAFEVFKKGFYLPMLVLSCAPKLLNSFTIGEDDKLPQSLLGG